MPCPVGYHAVAKDACQISSLLHSVSLASLLLHAQMVRYSDAKGVLSYVGSSGESIDELISNSSDEAFWMSSKCFVGHRGAQLISGPIHQHFDSLGYSKFGGRNGYLPEGVRGRVCW